MLFATFPFIFTHIFNVLMQAETDIDQDVTDFFDISMDGILEPDELDDYLSQAVEKVRDPIAWWWDHWKVFPRLSAMAFDYLSIPGRFLFSTLSYVLTSYLATSTAVKRVFSQGRQLLHFTRNWLSPASIWASLCFGDWCCKDIVRMSDVVDVIRGKGRHKRALEEEVLSHNEG